MATRRSRLAEFAHLREGLVIRDVPGEALNDENQIDDLFYRICRLAGLPERGWHTLGHTLGTHAALFGVNPWRLMTWLGHKRMDETLRYVHVADDHRRELPPKLIEAAAGEFDPDRRILKLLGARRAVELRHSDGTTGEKQRGKCILKLVKIIEAPPEFSEGTSAGWTGLEYAS
jgi:hypothetical protein